jgi:hypothetical protein
LGLLTIHLAWCGHGKTRRRCNQATVSVFPDQRIERNVISLACRKQREFVDPHQFARRRKVMGTAGPGRRQQGVAFQRFVEGARFGFPEILFNLFPGMGADSFLERKVRARKTEELISSGKIYSAGDMLELGLIDIVAPDGEGESAVASYIKARRHSRVGLSGLAAARRAVHALEYDELSRVVGIWVDTALRLSSRDLKLMQRLVSRQNKMHESRNLH